jgi:hypothetical protein
VSGSDDRREQALDIARTFREHARETHMADFAALMSKTADDLERFAAESWTALLPASREPVVH